MDEYSKYDSALISALEIYPELKKTYALEMIQFALVKKNYKFVCDNLDICQELGFMFYHELRDILFMAEEFDLLATTDIYFDRLWCCEEYIFKKCTNDIILLYFDSLIIKYVNIPYDRAKFICDGLYECNDIDLVQDVLNRLLDNHKNIFIKFFLDIAYISDDVEFVKFLLNNTNYGIPNFYPKSYQILYQNNGTNVFKFLLDTYDYNFFDMLVPKNNSCEEIIKVLRKYIKHNNLLNKNNHEKIFLITYQHCSKKYLANILYDDIPLDIVVYSFKWYCRHNYLINAMVIKDKFSTINHNLGLHKTTDPEIREWIKNDCPIMISTTKSAKKID